MLVPIIAFVASSGFRSMPLDDPASAELIQIVKEDQEDRGFMRKGDGKPTKEQMQAMQDRDKGRFKRTNEILDTAQTLTVAGLDAAALIMQHGTDLESYVRAHELSVCASLLGKPGSLIAASEDRYLMNLKRKQRFGAQFVGFGSDSKLYPVDEVAPTAVTESLRRIYFEPSLAAAKKFGLNGAFQQAQKETIETIQHRMDPDWIKSHSDPKVAAELKELVSGTPAARRRVLELYNADRLVSDDDFFQAAHILSNSSKPEELLLAHELATVALKEGMRTARSLFESTWDSFEVSIGHPTRYSLHKEPKAVQAVLEKS